MIEADEKAAMFAPFTELRFYNDICSIFRWNMSLEKQFTIIYA